MAVRIKGTQRVVKNFQKLSNKAGKEVARALYMGAHAVRGQAITDIMTVSAGRVVTRYKKGRKPYQHIASKEGDAPNMDTGDLVSRVNVEIQGNRAFVGTDLKYGAHLEFGTRRMGKRPWLEPALDKQRSFIVKSFEKALAKTVREAKK